MSHVVKSEELKLMFPNLAKLAAIGLLLPLSSVDCERGFSTPSRVETDLRNRLSSRILNRLLVIAIEGLSPTAYPYDQVCDLWSSWRNRIIQVDTYSFGFCRYYCAYLSILLMMYTCLAENEGLNFLRRTLDLCTILRP